MLSIKLNINKQLLVMQKPKSVAKINNFYSKTSIYNFKNNCYAILGIRSKA